ncbi:hypothetical protein HHI36_005924 [Cryptolaemus montrouzieri]|uniref:C2H2-type domain-containing protein n=1 Tax=Cryptolaemus montrouzieri TaxID=559131 RepID=A0ABD2NVL4_9CUCU
MDNAAVEGPLYSTDHEMVTNMNILRTEKRKRGRPKKQPVDKDKKGEDVMDAKNEISIDKSDVKSSVNDDGKRQRKIPARFSETVQGKELDDILRKEGIDEDDFGSDDNEVIEQEEEVIGRVESQDGEELGEPVIITKNLNRSRSKRTGFSPRKKRRIYRCGKCPFQFRNYPRLKVHMNTVHKNDSVEARNDDHNGSDKAETENGELDASKTLTNNEGMQKSDIASSEPPCEKTELRNNGTRTESEADKENGIKQESLTCDQCDKVFSNQQNLKTHKEGVHEKKKPFTCLECKQSFPYAKNFRMHQLKHKRGVYSCEVCQKKFNHPSSLVYHRNADHNLQRFACNKCNKTFKHRQLLHRHQLVHSEERPFKCELCDSAFKTKNNLVSHNAIHTGERNYACTECGQTFAHKTSLNLHMRWHLGEKPFSCDVCSKSFSQRGNLLEHQRIHTGEKPYCCDFCGRNFTTSSQLKLHSKRHTGERPWKCEFCPKSFLHKDSWKDHYRRHLNDRPYKCDICSKGFTAPYCLKKHMRFHTGEKPYSCEICLKGFTDSSNLTKHRRTHEQKLSEQKQVSLLNSNINSNLFYVYQQVPIVDMEQSQTEVVVSAEQEAIQFQQVVDQEGNPLSLNTQDGQQINVVTSITNGEEKLQGLLPDGTLVAIDLQDSKVESMERLIDNVEEETNVSHLLLDGNMTFLNENIDKAETNILVTEEPNVCFVAYDPSTGDIIQ